MKFGGKCDLGKLRFGEGKFGKGIFWESGILVIWDFGKVGFVEGRILAEWDFEKVGFGESRILEKSDFGKIEMWDLDLGESGTWENLILGNWVLILEKWCFEKVGCLDFGIM